jgi:hypothetical protein
MIIKLILSNLELDLSNYEFTLIEENNWLKENTISKYTYPGEIELTNEQDAALGNISEQNLSEYNTLLDAMFYVLGEEHEAVFEIQSIIGRNLVFQIRYGLEEFPNYNKRLSELPLYQQDLLVSIYAHAETIITQTWPAVNYNFPQVITDSIDTDAEQWQFFEGIINKYVDGDFIENEFDAVNNDQINRNIMVPMPYLLHIIKVGFEDAGFELQGEILDDTYYKKATAFALNDFYTKFNSLSEVLSLNTSEYTGPLSEFEGTYFLNIPIPEPGRYKIAGNVVVRTRFNEGFARFRFNDQTFWFGNAFSFALVYVERFFSVDFNIDFTGTEGDLTFFSQQLFYGQNNGVIDEEAMVLDVTLTQLAKYDANGNLIPTLVEATSIDLRKSVPDMSFGEYLTAVMKKRNYGYTIKDNIISIDKRKTINVDTSQAVDLSPFEVATPERNFNRGKTFEFKTFDYDSQEYPQPKIFIFNNGYIVNNYTKNDDTEEIVVNAIALPRKVFGVQTAHDFLNDNSKLQLVLYSGLTGGLNLAEDPEPISLLNNFLDDYQDWFNFLLTSQNMVWVFDASYEELAALKIRSIVYAYRQFHVIRKLTRKTYISSNRGILLEHEIETESLE